MGPDHIDGGLVHSISWNVFKNLPNDRNNHACCAAQMFLSEGDALDMRTNSLTMAWIEGREIDLDNRQRELYRKFQTKYGAEVLDRPDLRD